MINTPKSTKIGNFSPFSSATNLNFVDDKFSPLDLFKDGKQGVWYDPSDKSTLFQDVAGTIPVTKDGDPVALMIDKSQGVVLGSELVANGNFDTNINGWEVDQPTRTTATWVDGRVLVSPIDGAPYSSQSLKQSVPFKTGTTYKISIEHEGINTFRVRLGSTYVVFDNKGTGKQTYTGYVTLSSAASTLYVDMASGTSWLPADMYLDKISVKELKGNHATQSVSAARPVYKTDGVLHWFDTDGIDDYLRAVFSQVIPQPFTTSLGVQVNAVTGNWNYVLDSVSSSNRVYITKDKSDVYNFSAGIAYKYTGLSLTQPTVLSLNCNAASSSLTTNNITMSPISIGENGMGGVCLGANYIGNDATKVKYYGVIIAGMSAAERTNVASYLAKKSGVTL